MKKTSIILLAAVAVFAMACKGGGAKSPNGYTYINHTNVKEGAAAKPGDYAVVDISVFKDDSLVFSTYQNGQSLPMVVPDFSAITEEQKKSGAKPNPVADILAIMKVGDSVSVEVPIDSMMRKSPQMKDAKRLVYGVVMKELKSKEQYDQEKAAEQQAALEKAEAAKGQESAVAAQLGAIAKDYSAGKNKDKIKTTASGLKYMILEEGTGAQAVAGKKVDVMYYGILPNGKQFDNSYSRGEQFSFLLGQQQVIKGWDEGIALLKEGSKAVFFVPSDLGYGDQGYGEAIPPKSELIFFVELQKVN